MIIYVVQDMTGEYSDHCEWPVRAFLDEEKAKSFVIACDEEYRKHRASMPNKKYYDDKWKHPLDPNFNEDYTGTLYNYFSVELEQ